MSLSLNPPPPPPPPMVRSIYERTMSIDAFIYDLITESIIFYDRDYFLQSDLHSEYKKSQILV